MTRIKRFHEEWIDNFRWVQFWLRVLLIFALSASGLLFSLMFSDQKFTLVKLVLSVLFGFFCAASVADAFIANPKKLGWDYGRLKPTLPGVGQKSVPEPTVIEEKATEEG